ncbi:MAG: S41 family peptidase [Treponema sp.]|nr:S41 family peptidase [Treponema sp.]
MECFVAFRRNVTRACAKQSKFCNRLFILFFCSLSACTSISGDPYSKFLFASELMKTNDTAHGVFGGVGLYIYREKNSSDSLPYIEVLSSIEGTTGWLAGITSGDLIISIDGESTAKLSIDEAMARLRGWSGSTVNLVIRRGESLEFPVNLKRASIEVPTVKYAMIDGIGYLKVLTFTPNTADSAVNAIRYFEKNNYSSVILDLRNNAGGLMNSAVEVASLFLEDGIVARSKSRIPLVNRVYKTRRDSQVPSCFPVVVLINGGSASGSELIAGVLKERGRAYLVGEQSFGKGSMQLVLSLGPIGFKLTTAYYYTPENVSFDQIGITPDLIISEIDDAGAEKRRNLIMNNLVYNLEYDIQLQEAVNILNELLYPLYACVWP